MMGEVCSSEDKCPNYFMLNTAASLGTINWVDAHLKASLANYYKITEIHTYKVYCKIEALILSSKLFSSFAHIAFGNVRPFRVLVNKVLLDFCIFIVNVKANNVGQRKKIICRSIFTFYAQCSWI